MDFQTVVDALRYLAELGMAAGAWRLANALKFRVQDHETRITRVENHVGLAPLNHPGGGK